MPAFLYQRHRRQMEEKGVKLPQHQPQKRQRLDPSTRLRVDTERMLAKRTACAELTARPSDIARDVLERGCCVRACHLHFCGDEARILNMRRELHLILHRVDRRVALHAMLQAEIKV